MAPLSCHHDAQHGPQVGPIMPSRASIWHQNVQHSTQTSPKHPQTDKPNRTQEAQHNMHDIPEVIKLLLWPNVGAMCSNPGPRKIAFCLKGVSFFPLIDGKSCRSTRYSGPGRVIRYGLGRVIPPWSTIRYFRVHGGAAEGSGHRRFRGQVGLQK